MSSLLTSSSMNLEIQNFIKLWIIAITSIIYCYYIVSKIPSGLKTRLPFILPIIILFIILPFDLSSVHCSGFAFLYIVWLANFKLLLFAFNKPPLHTSPPLSLLHFIFIALLPIKSKQESQTSQNQELPKITKSRTKLFLTGIKCWTLYKCVNAKFGKIGNSHIGKVGGGTSL